MNQQTTGIPLRIGDIALRSTDGVGYYLYHGAIFKTLGLSTSIRVDGLGRHVGQAFSHDPEDIATCIAPEDVRHRQLEAALDLVERLRMEARIHAQEARTQRSIVQESYQAATGGTGEPCTSHGARPVVNELLGLRARVTMLLSCLRTLRDRLVAAGGIATNDELELINAALKTMGEPEKPLASDTD